MGVNGLLKSLTKIATASHLRNYNGCTCAIDASSWLHKGAVLDAYDRVNGKESDEYISYCLTKLEQLLSYNIQPIMVFDGAPMKAKAAENEERKETRRIALQETKERIKNAQFDVAQKMAKRSVEITPSMVYKLVQTLKRRGIKYCVAPYEADAQLAYLSLNGMVDIVISEDSDTLVYGCKVVLFKLQACGSCTEIRWENLRESNLLPKNVFNRDSFQLLCTLAGCDYAKNIYGIGLKRASDLIAKHQTNLLEIAKEIFYKHGEALSSMNLQNIRTALLTYRHQTVINSEYKTVSLTEPPVELSADDRVALGPYLSDEVAEGVGTGRLSPRTHIPFEEELNGSRHLYTSDVEDVHELLKRLTNNQITQERLVSAEWDSIERRSSTEYPGGLQRDVTPCSKQSLFQHEAVECCRSKLNVKRKLKENDSYDGRRMYSDVETMFIDLIEQKTLGVLGTSDSTHRSRSAFQHPSKLVSANKDAHLEATVSDTILVQTMGTSTPKCNAIKRCRTGSEVHHVENLLLSSKNHQKEENDSSTKECISDTKKSAETNTFCITPFYGLIEDTRAKTGNDTDAAMYEDDGIETPQQLRESRRSLRGCTSAICGDTSESNQQLEEKEVYEELNKLIGKQVESTKPTERTNCSGTCFYFDASLLMADTETNIELLNTEVDTATEMI